MDKIALKEPESYNGQLKFRQHSAYMYTQNGPDMANTGYPRKYLSAKADWHSIIWIKTISEKQYLCEIVYINVEWRWETNIFVIVVF